MKKYIKPKSMLMSGVSIENNTPAFHWDSDSHSDIISLAKNISAEFDDNNVRCIYAYAYTDTATKQDEKVFRDYIKGTDGRNGLLNPDVEEFVNRGVLRIEQYCSFSDFGATVNAKPTKTPSLVGLIGSYIDEYVDGSHLSFQLIKQTYQNVMFDERKARNALLQSGYSRDRAESEIRKTTQKFYALKESGQLFEMKRFVPREIRSGFFNFLKFANDEEKQTYLNLQGTNVLVYDDFFTSGGTIREMIRCLRSIHNRNTLTVFVLIKQ